MNELVLIIGSSGSSPLQMSLYLMIQQVTHWVRTRTNQTIAVMHFKHRRPRFTLLFSHGNAEDLGLNANFCRWLSSELDVDIFSYDYSGCGDFFVPLDLIVRLCSWVLVVQIWVVYGLTIRGQHVGRCRCCV